MLNLKRNFSYMNLKILLNVCTSYIFCSLCELEKNELIKLSPLQKSSLDKMLEEIFPKYQLITYLVDPIETNICYLFIENTFYKEISYFTLFLNDEKSLQLIKNKILYANVLVNTIFDKCFIQTKNIQNEIEEFKSKIVQFYVIKFNNIMKIILTNFFDLIRNVDKTNLIEININYNIELFNNRTLSFILNNLSTVISLSYKIRNINISNINLILADFNNLQILESFIIDKIFNLYNFNSLSIKIKVYQVNKLARYVYFFCNKKQIFTNHVIKYVLQKINMIENKLSKYTFVLCFIKIFNDTNTFKMKSKILKLMIIILLYIKKYLNGINNAESLTLLYNITRKCNFESLTSFASSEMCFIENNINCNDMRKVLIYQYIYFIFTRRDINIMDIIKLFLYNQYFELIWLIIKICTIAMHNIFQINF